MHFITFGCPFAKEASYLFIPLKHKAEYQNKSVFRSTYGGFQVHKFDGCPFVCCCFQCFSWFFIFQANHFQDASRIDFELQKSLKMAPKYSQEPPKTLPRRHQELPRSLQECQRSLQEAQKDSQEAAYSSQDAAKRLQEGPREDFGTSGKEFEASRDRFRSSRTRLSSFSIGDQSSKLTIL